MIFSLDLHSANVCGRNYRNQKYKCSKADFVLASKLNSKMAQVDSFLEVYLP